MSSVNDNMENKVHHKQEAFYADNCRNRWIFGGNRTGKTHAGAHEAVRFAIEKPCEGWVVSLSQQVQRDVAQKAVLEELERVKKMVFETPKISPQISPLKRGGETPTETYKIHYKCVMLSGRAGSPKYGVIDFITVTGEVFNPRGGRPPNRPKIIFESKIGFKSCEQGREKFQGVALDWVWFDEEPPIDIYDECVIRTLDKGGVIWGTMTPLKGRSWVYEKIYLCADGESISIHCWSWEDNPFLSEREIRKMERSFSGEQLESRKFGRFGEGLGLVYKEFSEKNIIEFGSKMLQNEKWVYNGISIDPGYTNPTAVLWFGVDGQDNIYVLGEYKESGRNVEQIAKSIKEISDGLGLAVENVFIDSASVARTLGEPNSVAEQFRAHGIDVNTNVEKNVLEGVFEIKKLLCASDGTRKLFICDNCVALIAEMRSYFWGDKNRPIKNNDHCLDALRYFVMSERKGEFSPQVIRGRRDIFEKHKRRLIRENR